MQQAELRVELRDKDNLKPKTLRASGQVPGVFYANNTDSVLFSVEEKELSRLLSHEHTIIDVVFPKGGSKKCIIREIQQDPVTSSYLHIDLLGVDMNQKVKLMVPISLIGTSIGAKTEGGIMEQLIREVEVEALPLDLPEHIQIDVSEMHLGQAVYVEDLDQTKMNILAADRQAIVHIIQPRVVKEDAEVDEDVETDEEDVSEE